MMKSVSIIGAGMAGLLAARMLHRYNPVVYERQKELPNNHSAVLRFRTPKVGEILGVPFRKVKVIKSTAMWHGPTASMLAYSNKTTGTYLSDRSLPIKAEIVDRWIAPPNLVTRMAEGVKVVYDTPCDIGKTPNAAGKYISTIPMPDLMIMLDYKPQPVFGYSMSTNIVATLDRCDAYVSLYVPDPATPISRISITGDQLVVECLGVPPSSLPAVQQCSLLKDACRILGIDYDRTGGRWDCRPQRYGKIAPIDEGERKNFIYWASTLQNKAYSLGRFACWRPGLLLDDVVEDVRAIERMMVVDSRYDEERRHMSSLSNSRR